jgi:uncharacterized protein YecE (DUF72 family)
MRVFVGTSGFGYKEWKPEFYPEDLKDADFLGYYATKLPVVEINSTFYRFPSKGMLAGWAPQVPEGFLFALKVPGRITHQARLKGASEAIAALFENVMSLGSKLGPVIFGLPPNFPKDILKLNEAIANIPKGVRVTFEFRHPSWQDEEVYAALRSKGVALCLAESDDASASDDLNAPLVSTADWGYLRLRKSDYAEAELEAWSKRIAAQNWKEVFVFIKHEASAAPGLAVRLQKMISG